uniref:Uncharacterized protein n=1 Tax=Clytia hemisphaerica TaxID=252671 RepID=A0A7M5X7E5_9CNID
AAEAVEDELDDELPLDQEDEENESESDEIEQDEDEDEDEESEDLQDQADAGHVRYFPKKRISRKKVDVFVNKNVGECKNTRADKPNKCWYRRKCVKRGGLYNRRCVRVVVRKYCQYKYTTTCKFCSKYYIRACYRIRYSKYKSYVRCYRSKDKESCKRDVSGTFNKTVLESQKFFNVKGYPHYFPHPHGRFHHKRVHPKPW